MSLRKIRRNQETYAKKKEKKLMNMIRKEDIENYDFKTEMEKVLEETSELLTTINNQEAFLNNVINGINLKEYEDQVLKIMEDKRNHLISILKNLVFTKERIEFSLNQLKSVIPNIKNDDDSTLIDPTSIFFTLSEDTLNAKNIFHDINMIITNDMDME